MKSTSTWGSSPAPGACSRGQKARRPDYFVRSITAHVVGTHAQFQPNIVWSVSRPGVGGNWQHQGAAPVGSFQAPPIRYRRLLGHSWYPVSIGTGRRLESCHDWADSTGCLVDAVCPPNPMQTFTTLLTALRIKVRRQRFVSTV